MQFHEFLGLVQNRAKLASDGEALRTTRAFLEVLGQRLFGGESADLASQLPHELQLFLIQPESGESFDLDEFYQRIAVHEGVDLPTAIRHARAVMSVVLDAVSPGEIEDMLSQLPDNYNDIFGWGSSPGEEMTRAA